MSNFLQAFETKHLFIGIGFTLLGWAFSQIYSLGIEQSAMKVYLEQHGEAIQSVTSLPQEQADFKERMNESLSIIFNNLAEYDKTLDEHETRISIIEDRIGQEVLDE